MKKFASKGTYELLGKGKVIEVENDIYRDTKPTEDFPLPGPRDFSDLRSGPVEIDGKFHIIKAVEYYAIDAVWPGELIGLLVEEVHLRDQIAKIIGDREWKQQTLGEAADEILATLRNTAQKLDQIRKDAEEADE